MNASMSMTRRQVMLAAGYGLIGKVASAATLPTVVTEDVRAEAFQIKVTKYIVPGSNKRPTILLLHGSRGLVRPEVYEPYARDLAAAGIDTWLFSYFGPDDRAAIKDAGSEAARKRQYARLIDRWVAGVRAIAGKARDQERSSGRVGVLGFSLGGYVAVAAASQPLFSVLTVFYGGLPTFYQPPISSLPPLIDIHGDRDQAVPLSEGSKLVAAAKRLGGVAELVVFPGEGHGFDLNPANRNAVPARQRAVSFAAHWINQD